MIALTILLIFFFNVFFLHFKIVFSQLIFIIWFTYLFEYVRKWSNFSLFFTSKMLIGPIVAKAVTWATQRSLCHLLDKTVWQHCIFNQLIDRNKRVIVTAFCLFIITWSKHRTSHAQRLRCRRWPTMCIHEYSNDDGDGFRRWGALLSPYAILYFYKYDSCELLDYILFILLAVLPANVCIYTGTGQNERQTNERKKEKKQQQKVSTTTELKTRNEMW